MNNVVITFGRFGCPTIGHMKLIRKMADFAVNMNCQAGVFLSHSYDGIDSPKFKYGKTRNPLKYDDKRKIMEKLVYDLPDNITIAKSPARNIYEALHEIYRYTQDAEKVTVYIFCGDDRVAEYETVRTYNGKETEKYFKFKEIRIKSAGGREGTTDEENASATLLRQCVYDLDLEKFTKFFGCKELVEETFDLLLHEMGVNTN